MFGFEKMFVLRTIDDGRVMRKYRLGMDLIEIRIAKTQFRGEQGVAKGKFA